MLTKKDIEQQIKHLNGAVARKLIKQVRQCEPLQLCSRKNYDGHITASAVIFYDYKILLLHHVTLDKWLTPGGHIDPNDASIVAGVLREVQEETGITADQLTAMNVVDGTQYCFEVNTHHIPHNKLKKEKAHLHHDFRFVFRYVGPESVNLNKSESYDYKWMWFMDEYLTGSYSYRLFEIILHDIFNRFDSAEPSVFNEKRKWLSLVHLVRIYEKSRCWIQLKQTAEQVIAINKALAKDDEVYARRLDDFTQEYGAFIAGNSDNLCLPQVTIVDFFENVTEEDS